MEEEDNLGLDPIDINTQKPIDLGSSKDFDADKGNTNTQIGSKGTFDPGFDNQFVSEEFDDLMAEGRQFNWNLNPKDQQIAGEQQVADELAIKKH